MAQSRQVGGAQVDDVTPWLVRVGQRVPQGLYVGLIVLAFITGISTIVWSSIPALGATSAALSAVAAWGFVVHARPRVLTSKLSTLSWDPVAEELAMAGLVSYESSFSGDWTVLAKQHRKGRYPLVRLAERQDQSSPWAECEAGTVVGPGGDVTVQFQVQRSVTEGSTEVLLTLS